MAADTHDRTTLTTSGHMIFECSVILDTATLDVMVAVAAAATALAATIAAAITATQLLLQRHCCCCCYSYTATVAPATVSATVAPATVSAAVAAAPTGCGNRGPRKDHPQLLVLHF